MSNNSRWPEAWDQLVDRVNQDPNIQAFEEIDSFNGGRGAISSLKNLKTKEKFTCFTSHDSKHDGRMYFVYDDDYTIPVGRSVKGKRRRTQTLATVDELIDLFNKSYNSVSSENEMGVTESKQPIKLKTLLEGYAWERKPGKPLPTLSEVQEEYQRNLQEETEYKVAGRPVTLNKNGTEDQTKWTVTFANGKTEQYSSVISLIKPRPKLQEPRWQDNDGDGKWYEKGDDVNEDFEGGYGGNKRRRWDDKPGYSRGEWDDTYNFKRGNDVEANWPAEWNELVDSVNQDPNIEASEKIDYRAAISRLKNIETGEVWELIQPQQGDMYVAYRPEGRMSDYSVKTLEDLIASFKGVKQESVNLTENMRRFGTKNI